jgi:hypothetical protein
MLTAVRCKGGKPQQASPFRTISRDIHQARRLVANREQL